MSKIYVFLLIILLTILLSFDTILGCAVIDWDVYWNDACSGDSERWKDFTAGFGTSCAIGPSSEYGHGNEYWWWKSDGWSTWCERSQDVVWRYMGFNSWPGGAIEGLICKVRWNDFCNFAWGGDSSHRWDPEDWGCVECIAGNKQGTIDKCGWQEPATNKCEEACGAIRACDEQDPGSDITHCGCENAYFADKCDSNCGCIDRGDYICRSAAFASDCDADSRCDGFAPDQQGNCPVNYKCSSDCQCVGLPISSSSTTTSILPYCQGSPSPCISFGDEGSCTSHGCDWVVSSTTTGQSTTTRRTTTTRRGGGGGGCGLRCLLMAWGLDYTNILVIIIALVVVIVVIFGFKFFVKKK